MNATHPATALCHARVLTPDGFVEGLAVLMQDGLIADLVAVEALSADVVRHRLVGEIVEAYGRYDATVGLRPAAPHRGPRRA